jgi:O-antigen/teichoic acid export membrane protein
MATANFQKYASNSIWMLAEQGLRIVAGVFVGIYIARYLGPEQFGVLSYVLAISAFVMALSRLGMDAVLVRELVTQEGRKNSVLGTAFWMMLATGVACFLLTLSVIWNTGETQQLKVFISICAASGIFTSFLAIDYFFQAQVKAKYSSICKFSALLSMSVVKLILVFLGADLFWFVVASLIDHVVLAAIFLSVVASRFDLAFLSRFDRKIAKEMLKSCWPMVLSSLAILLYMRIDQVMIKNMLGLEQVGLYSAAVKIYESWIMFPVVLTVSLLPAITKLKASDPVIYQKRLSQIFRLVHWLSVAAAIVATILAEPVITFAFGEAYRASAGVVSIVMWTGVFAAMGSVSARYFNVEKMEKKMAARTFVAAISNILLNLLLIPRYGIDGAAIATLCCTFLANYVMDWFDKDLRLLLQIKHRAMFTLK